MKKKCKAEGCYEPADCSHGYCHAHCDKTHAMGSYANRAYPRTNEPHIGVEIEVEFANQQDLKRALPLNAQGDGSLQMGAEYKVLAKSNQICDKAAEVLEDLWSRRAKVTQRCGLHVHMDARNVPNSQLVPLFKWFRRTEAIWFGLVPPSRRNNTYIHKLDDLSYNGGIPSQHYDWVHKTHYSTIEVRLHGGTLNPHKLIGWLQVLIHLQKKFMDPAFRFNVDCDPWAAFWEVFVDAPSEAVEYLNTRIAKNGRVPDYAYATAAGQTVDEA